MEKLQYLCESLANKTSDKFFCYPKPDFTNNDVKSKRRQKIR